MESEEQKQKRAISVLRVAASDQGFDERIIAQREKIARYAVEHGYILVGEVVSRQGSASTEILALMRRKRDANDFEAVLLTERDLLTRRCLVHWEYLRKQFLDIGVSLICTDGATPVYAGLIMRNLLGTQRRSNSLFLHEGVRVNFKHAGYAVRAARNPFGVDRLDTDERGQPLFVFRDEPDGTQVQLRASDREVVRVFPPGCHCFMRSRDYPSFVPSLPERVETVRRIFNRRCNDAWTFRSIAAELLSMNSPAPTAGGWTPESVSRVLANTVYLGWGVATRISQISYRHHADCGKPRMRQMKHWTVVEYPYLKDVFMSSELRDRLWNEQLAAMKRRRIPPSP